MENPIKIHDLGVPLFLETPKSRIQTKLYNVMDAGVRPARLMEK